MILLKRARQSGVPFLVASDLPSAVFVAFYPRRFAAGGDDAIPDRPTAGSSRPECMTVPDFESMLATYRSLELRVEVLMSAACTPYCAVCPTPCCRTAICREAAESPFLLAVHGSRQAFDAKLGYLGATGCKLGAGRPPVCHAFICGRILSQQESEHHRYALECLGDLVGFLGKQVWLKRHLVEALSEADLEKSNMHRFQSRLDTGSDALVILEKFFSGGQNLEASEITRLAMIRKPGLMLPQ